MGNQSSKSDESEKRADPLRQVQEEVSASSSSSLSIGSPELLFSPCDDDWPWVWAIRDGNQLDWRKACPTPDLLQERALEQMQLPVCIQTRLYLGNAECISNVEYLQSLGITSVLNVANNRDLVSVRTQEALHQAGIEYVHVACLDEVDYPLLARHWSTLQDTLRRLTHGRGKRCVVHCREGQNRASFVVAAYHMVTTQCTVLETVRILRRQRGNHALLNFGFQEQLVALARTMDLLGPAPGTPGSIVKASPPARTDAWIVPKSTKVSESTNISWRNKWREIRQVSLRRNRKLPG